MTVRRLCWTTFGFGIAAMILSGIVTAAEPPAKPKKKMDNGARPEEKAVLSDKTVLRADVAYGKDAKQRLDVYAPRGVADAPIVIFFHRGEWTKGDKSEVSYKPKFLNEQGIVFVAANYRLSPAVTHPAHIKDVAAAVRWVYDHAAEFGGSPKKIVVIGHSAGCHLVTLLALDPRYLAGVGLQPTDLRGVVAWSGGAYDLVAKVKAGGSYGPYVKQAFGDSEAAWRDASPIAHVGDAKTPPFLFASCPATAERKPNKATAPAVKSGLTSQQAAEQLANLITNAKGRASVVVLKDRTHMTANHLLGAPDDKTGTILVNFVREVTRSGGTP
jgi:arylformamidase